MKTDSRKLLLAFIILSICKEINHTFAKKIANGKSRFIKGEIRKV